MSIRIPPHKCKCGYVMDASMDAYGSDEPPRPGHDVSLCFHCGRIWFFNSDLTQREPKEEEMRALMASEGWPRVVKARSHIFLNRPA